MTDPRRAEASAAAVILAGGLSKRFGADKASALLQGRSLIQWVVSAVEAACSEVVIVAATDQKLPDVDCRVPIQTVTDVYDKRGPLAGMVSGFEHVGSGLCLVAACDLPLLQPLLVRHLLEVADNYDVVCPRIEGELQPLAALYRPRTCLPVFRRRVEEGELKVIDAFAELRRRYIEAPELRRVDPDLRSFMNANTPEKLATLGALLGSGDPQ